jgi:hypothetical protein
LVVAACYGQALITDIRLSRPAPCFALFGPTSTIEQGEVGGVFRSFYGTLFRTLDLGAALQAVAGHTLSSGWIQPMTARNWFELLMSKYLREHTTPRAIKEYARRQYSKSKCEGNRMGMREWKRQFRRDIPNVVHRYFETFFMIEDQKDRARYRSVWSRLEAELAVAFPRR